jgi:hypothetical protein
VTDHDRDSRKPGGPSGAAVVDQLRTIRKRAAEQRARARRMRADAAALRERVRRSLGTPGDDNAR